MCGRVAELIPEEVFACEYLVADERVESKRNLFELFINYWFRRISHVINEGQLLI